MVSARSATAQYQAITNKSGVYVIPSIVADRYQIEVSRPGFLPDDEYNRRWSGRMVLNPATKVIEPDRSEPKGSVTIAPGSCQVWDLSMWPDGRISGVVTDRAAKPLKGITVQAFAFNHQGERESRPLRTATTDSEGRYSIEPLPSGSYVVGINGEKYSDREPYSPTFYVRGGDLSKPDRIDIEDGASAEQINLVAPDPRTTATLVVEVRRPDGLPCKGARISLENMSGIQRYFADKDTPDDGTIEVPAYVAEQYIVRAYAPGKPFEDWRGSTPVQVTRDGTHVVIHVVQTRSDKHQ